MEPHTRAAPITRTEAPTTKMAEAITMIRSTNSIRLSKACSPFDYAFSREIMISTRRFDHERQLYSSIDSYSPLYLTLHHGELVNNEMGQRWHDEDEFWEIHTKTMFSEERIERTHEQVNALVALLNINQDDTILDLCCGVGRHSLELARRGFKVTGVDRTRHYLEIARTRAEEEKLDVNFIEADMREFQKERVYDVILSMFTSFGYFEDPQDQFRVLNNMYASLKHGGRALFDLLGKEKLARVFRERDWYHAEAGFKLEERRISKDWSWVDSTWILITDEGEVNEWSVSHWIYSAAEMKAMLKSVGFNEHEVYGSLAGTPYDHDAIRLIVIGRKT